MQLDHNERQNKQELYITFYLIIYSVLLVKFFLDTTMFNISWPEVTPLILTELTAIFIGAKILLIDKHSKKEKLLYFFLAVCFLGAAIHARHGFLLVALLLILGAKNVPFKRLVQLFCAIAGTLIVITMISSQVGLVENLVYTRGVHNRISFGFIYPTDFTAHIFYLVMGYCYLRKGKLTSPELAGILGLSVFSFIFCEARTNAICLLLTFAVFLYLKIINRVRDNNGSHYVLNPIGSRVLTFSMPLYALCFIGLTFLYHYQPSNILTTINSVVSNRLHLGSIGLERYGIHLFGSAFQMVGYGGSTTSPESEYFFLDSSYSLLLIGYGLLVFLAVMTIFVLSSWRAEKQKDIALLWILTLISIQCMLEHHLLDIAYNPFLFLIFSETLTTDRDEPGSINNAKSKLLT